MQIVIASNYLDRTYAGHIKARFQFSVRGTEQQGVVYVTEALTADRQADIARAAKKAGKRAGADVVTIHSIGF